jgi:hypothetical protein
MVEGAVEALFRNTFHLSGIFASRADQEEDCPAHEGKEKKPSEIIGETENSEEPITAIVDSTGLTTTTKREPTLRTSGRKKRKEKRKFLKLHRFLSV